MKTGDIMVMELGRFVDNANMTRLIKVKVEEVSFNAKKALVTMLPPDPEKKDVIRAEKYSAGKSKILDVRFLFRDEQHYRDSCEFRVGDVVAWCGWSVKHQMATVIRVKKTSLTLLGSEGRTFEAGYGNAMVISRPSNENDPGVTETSANG